MPRQSGPEQFGLPIRHVPGLNRTRMSRAVRTHLLGYDNSATLMVVLSVTDLTDHGESDTACDLLLGVASRTLTLGTMKLSCGSTQEYHVHLLVVKPTAIAQRISLNQKFEYLYCIYRDTCNRLLQPWLAGSRCWGEPEDEVRLPISRNRQAFAAGCRIASCGSVRLPRRRRVLYRIFSWPGRGSRPIPRAAF